MILCFSDKKVSSFANCPNLSNVVWNWSHLFLADWFLYFYWTGNTRDKEIRLTETHEDVRHGHVDDVHVGGGLHVLPRQHHHHHQQVAEDTDLQTENNFLLQFQVEVAHHENEGIAQTEQRLDGGSED